LGVARHNDVSYQPEIDMHHNSKISLISTLFLLSLLAACAKEPAQPAQDPGSAEVVQEDVAEAAELVEMAEQKTRIVQQEEVLEPIPEDSFAVDKSDPNWKQNLQQPGIMMFEDGKRYFWDMQTNKGEMSFELFHQTAPKHVTSTIYLTEIGFYDSVIFHRVIPGFMAQGGDPTGTGMGGPGYKYEGEFSPSVLHDRPGILSMANAGPGTDGSQFFITFVPTKHLNGKHTVFGGITGGMDTLRELEKSGTSSGRTSEKLEIIKATIRVE
jgi:peptidyl-prolyl cis-trans isomerase B (cyclophilin B)